MNRTKVLRIACLFAFASAACSSSAPQSSGSGGSSSGSGGSGSGSGGSNSSSGGSNGSGGSSSSSGGSTSTGGSGSGSGGSTSTGGSGSGSGGSGTSTGGSGSGTGGTGTGTGGSGTSTGGSSPGTGGAAPGTGGTAPGSGGSAPVGPLVVTSASGAFWKTDGKLMEVTSGTADVTVNDGTMNQTWDGFGGAFNELGWAPLTSDDMKNQAIKLLFSATDGAHFGWGRIPMGASDYAMNRYTLDDTGTDVKPDSSESNRPPADTSLTKFSLDRDTQKLIPYIKAAKMMNPDLKFWASPWTPPVWMKTSYKKNSGADTSMNAKVPSYFDGGNMKSDSATLAAYAQYYTKFVQGYKDMGINIEIVSAQNEPGYDQNYPSCLWDKTTYTTWVGQHLGPAMKTLGVKVMLGTLSNAGDNSRTDLDISSAVLADSTAKSFLAVTGVQWGVLDKVNGGQSFGGLPVWATEHKCGNYPWNPTGSPKYTEPAPNDQAYGVESWNYIRDAINKGKVTAYNAWNMVLDKSGLGIDTTRPWAQDALLVADGGKVNPTPAYYVFRHLSQYVTAGAKVVTTTGGDAVAFKNPDGSLVAIMFATSAKSTYTVKIGGKLQQFSMPANGWATVVFKP